MSTPFQGEIRMGGWTFAPVNWAFCNGALMAISQNDALFSLLGTTYGGDGVQTFGLPDLQGRIPMHIGTNFVQGQKAGSESITLNTLQIPAHTHQIYTTPTASSATPVGFAPAAAPNGNATYNGANNPTSMGNLMGTVGSSLPHENRMPLLAVTFVIALYGVYPTRN